MRAEAAEGRTLLRHALPDRGPYDADRTVIIDAGKASSWTPYRAGRGHNETFEDVFERITSTPTPSERSGSRARQHLTTALMPTVRDGSRDARTQPRPRPHGRPSAHKQEAWRRRPEADVPRPSNPRPQIRHIRRRNHDHPRTRTTH